MSSTIEGKRIVLAVQYICPQFQAALSATVAGHHPPLSYFGDGTYKVGVDIIPGTYQTADQAVQNCYWERTDANGATIDNGFVPGSPQVRVTIRAFDFGFHSKGCVQWQKVG